MTDGPTPEATEGAGYNPIFERLVGDPERGDTPLQGFVAYGLYKIAKREWVSEFRERYRRKPSDAELDAYVSTWTQSQLQGALDRVEQVLAAFAATIIQEEEPKTLRRALRGRFWRAFWPSIVASFVYTLVLIFLALVLTWAGIYFLGIFRSVRGG